MAIEDDDADRFDLNQAPTRWGRVDYTTRFNRAGRQATTTIAFAARSPWEAPVRFRLPEGARPGLARVNGRRARLDGDMVVIDARAAARSPADRVPLRQPCGLPPPLAGEEL